MSESTQSLHHPKTRLIMKHLEKDVDDNMFARETIRDALDTAVEYGGVGIFLLDCLVAEHQVSDHGVGKVPIVDPEKVAISSAMLYQVEPMKRVCEVIGEVGLHVGVFAFLGDDDWKYSVSPEFGIAHPEIKQLIGQQTGMLQEAISGEFDGSEVLVTAVGWTSYEENDPSISETRSQLLDALKSQEKSGAIHPKIAARLKQFSDYRKEIVKMSGIDPQDIVPPIAELAVQEMTSFVLQGMTAPDVIHQEHPEFPLIFANSFPNPGTQKLDDECVRFGIRHCNMQGYSYGTIHLPGPDGLAYRMRRSQLQQHRQFKKQPGQMLTCGDPGSFNPKK